jgi:hypothetical protein
MAEVVLKVFHRNDGQRTLVRTVNIRTESAKALNARSALRILRKAVPDLSSIAFLMPFEAGWKHSRTLHPKEKCLYHYIWEDLYIFEDASGTGPTDA